MHPFFHLPMVSTCTLMFLDLLKGNAVVKKFVGAADKLSGVVLVDKRSELWRGVS